MRYSMAIIGCLLACGCANQSPSQSVPVVESRWSTTPQADSPALALACDPAIIRDQPALYLDRESRQPAAFAGYDQPTVTYSYLRSDDDYTFDHGRFNREAVTERIGVSTR
jgi:hypothetical protein